MKSHDVMSKHFLYAAYGMQILMDSFQNRQATKLQQHPASVYYVMQNYPIFQIYRGIFYNKTAGINDLKKTAKDRKTLIGHLLFEINNFSIRQYFRSYFP